MAEISPQIRDRLNRIMPMPLSDTDWAFYENNATLVTFRKGQFLLKAGQIEEYVYFLVDGLVRLYFSQGEREICIDFGFKNHIVCSFISYFTQQPSAIQVQALMPTVALRLPRKILEEWHKSSLVGGEFGRMVMQLLYVKKLEKEMQMLTQNAEERYELLQKKQPHFIQYISVKDLASYLGIHPDSLSRIRRKFSSNS